MKHHIYTITLILLFGTVFIACEVPVESDQTRQGEQQTSEPSEVVYSMNEDIDVDYITYRVTKVETFTEMGSTFLNRQTEGKFIKVHLRLTNNDLQTRQLFTPRFRVRDSLGRTYDRLSDDMMYIEDYIEFGKQLQPGLGTSGAVVFELPETSTDLELIISGDWLSMSQVRVTLSDIEDIGSDQTQQQEMDRMWDETMEQSERQMEEAMNRCSAPFRCSPSCAEYMDVGQMDCPTGQLCCMQ